MEDFMKRDRRLDLDFPSHLRALGDAFVRAVSLESFRIRDRLVLAPIPVRVPVRPAHRAKPHGNVPSSN